VIAVDGKTLRGPGHGGQHSRHLLAALDHAHGAVLGQVEVEAKTNEIPMSTTLLDRVDIKYAVITADALHAQHGHATYLHRHGATTCRSSSATGPACTPSSPPSSAATGGSKTACTGSVTSTSMKTARRSAPPAARASWHPCATW
jgi:predicted transposase YbfD/YdcC